MSDASDWKQRLRQLLQERGWTYRELADRAGLQSPTHVSSMLSAGGPRSPNGDTLVRLAAALGVSSDWLMTGEGERERGATPESTVVVRDEMPPDGIKRFGDCPGYEEAEAEALRLWGDVLPQSSWGAVREMRGARWPERITAKMIYRFAKTWFEQASEEEQYEQERAEIMRQIAAYRATDEAKRRGHG